MGSLNATFFFRAFCFSVLHILNLQRKKENTKLYLFIFLFRQCLIFTTTIHFIQFLLETEMTFYRIYETHSIGIGYMAFLQPAEMHLDVYLSKLLFTKI